MSAVPGDRVQTLPIGWVSGLSFAALLPSFGNSLEKESLTCELQPEHRFLPGPGIPPSYAQKGFPLALGKASSSFAVPAAGASWGAVGGKVRPRGDVSTLAPAPSERPRGPGSRRAPLAVAQAWFKVLCLRTGSWKTPSTQFLRLVTGESWCLSRAPAAAGAAGEEEGGRQ